MCTEVEPLALRPEKLTSRALARALSAKLTMHLCGIYGRPALTSILFEKNFRIPLILNIRGGFCNPALPARVGGSLLLPVQIPWNVLNDRLQHAF